MMICIKMSINVISLNNCVSNKEVFSCPVLVVEDAKDCRSKRMVSTASI